MSQQNSNPCLYFVKLLFDNLMTNVYCLSQHKLFDTDDETIGLNNREER